MGADINSLYEQIDELKEMLGDCLQGMQLDAWKARLEISEAALVKEKEARAIFQERCSQNWEEIVELKVERDRLREALEKIIAIESLWLGYCPDCFERPKLIARDALKEPT